MEDVDQISIWYIKFERRSRGSVPLLPPALELKRLRRANLSGVPVRTGIRMRAR